MLIRAHLSSQMAGAGTVAERLTNKGWLKMGMWAKVAEQTIERVHRELPTTATLAERKAALRAAYPFGSRECSPYKTWCKKQREYLRRFEPMTEKTAPLFVSPLDRAKAKFEAAADAAVKYGVLRGSSEPGISKSASSRACSCISY